MGYFKPLADAYRDRRDVAVILIHWDGRATSQTRAWLKNGGVDFDYAYYASDRGGAYAALLWPDGRPGEFKLGCGTLVHSAPYVAATPDRKVFAERLVKHNDTKDWNQVVPFGKAASTLPPDRSYPAELVDVVKAVEAGNWEFALGTLEALKSKDSEVQAAAAELRQLIENKLDTRVASLVAVLQDPASGERFRAFMKLRVIAESLGRTNAGRTAARAVKAAGKDKAIKAELKAEAAYLRLAQQVKPEMSPQLKDALAKAFGKLAEKHAGTHFGAEAERTAAALGQAP